MDLFWLEEGDDGSAIFRPPTIEGVLMQNLEDLPDNTVFTQDVIDNIATEITTPLVPVTVYLGGERTVIGTGQLKDGPDGLGIVINLDAGEDANYAVDRIIMGNSVGFSFSSAPITIDTSNAG